MEILLVRKTHTAQLTLGEVYLDNKFFAYSLEDTVRPRGVIIPEETAVQAGRYEVIWAWSPAFQRYTPRLVGVPGFLGVLIHVGNFPRDTRGCILMGLKLYRDGIGESQKAMNWLYPFLKNLLVKEKKKVYITIR